MGRGNGRERHLIWARWVSLCTALLICGALLAAAASPAQAAKIKVYVDTSAVDARTDMTQAEKDAVKTAIKSEIKKNLETAFGPGNVEVTNEAADKKSADRTVTIKDELGTFKDKDGNTQHKWGDWPHGSGGVNVYLKNYMDRWGGTFKSGDPPKWDTTKLGTAIGTTAAHELAHSFSAGHDDHDTNKMNSANSATELGNGLNLKDAAKKTLQENQANPPCKTTTNYSTECCMADWWSDPMLPIGAEIHESPTVTAVFARGGPLAPMFDFGWWGADTDNGTLDGNPSADFIYKSSMTGTPLDSPTICFFEGWTAHFVIRGREGTPYEGIYREVEPADWMLLNPIMRPDGTEVYRQAIAGWDVDALPGIDVSISLDTLAYGTPFNGFTRGIANRLAVHEAKLRVDGSYVALRGILSSRVFSDHFYVQSFDRSSGIRVEWGTGPVPPMIPEGAALLIEGKMGTKPTIERVLMADPTKVQLVAGRPVLPLGMSNRAVGGGDFDYAPGIWASGQQGVEGGTGLNNIGLLISTWGRIVELEPVLPPKRITWLRIKDGSGRRIKCTASGEIAIPPHWLNSYCSATGISICEIGAGGKALSQIQMKRPDDLLVY